MKNLLTVLKYSLLLGASAFLMWYALKELDFEKLWAELQSAKYGWVILSLVLGIAAYVSRAYRWQMQIKPTGITPSLLNTYNAMMVGYVANLVLPRMGEVVRCSILKKTDNLPVNTGFGTVIAERFIDMVMLLLITGLTFLVEFNRIRDFFFGLFSDKYSSISQSLNSFYYLGAVLFALLIVGVILIVVFLNRLRSNRFYKKVVGFVQGMLQGIFSISKIENKFSFWAHTVFVWAMYYGMSQVVFYALPATQSLPLGAGLSVLVAGSLGMAAPVQGGIGVYHLVVQATLLLYGVPKEEAMAYALLAHTSQTLLVVIMGVFSFMISMLQQKKNSAALNYQNHASAHELKR
ncbi:lysylphosphatidylglycerol synthase transmembrane domain-containing protein [Pontibacter arcticus]|uniref:UPF0104 family protein n=1 Tax=Pontibacter arcticus TaxID=2080288 RepID=A0A364RIV0_9BACT|nr:lysylphosphatidylglycerol synthase transmembrane domain-containing protein [Pontibacter arcticus]RAU84204.1 UPF0104 family protein [Pontibacter arcticus]